MLPMILPNTVTERVLMSPLDVRIFSNRQIAFGVHFPFDPAIDDQIIGKTSGCL